MAATWETSPLEIAEETASALLREHGLLMVRIWLVAPFDPRQPMLATVQQMHGRTYGGLAAAAVGEILSAPRPAAMLLDRVDDDARFEPPVPAGSFVGLPLIVEGKPYGYVECYTASDAAISFETAAELQRKASEAAARVAGSRRDTAPEAPAPAAKGQRILIADDDPEIRGMLRALLRRNGYAVLEARNGLETYDLAKQEQPDLVLVDWVMPLLEGLETTKRLKADPQTARIPVIMVTGQSRVDDKVMGLEAGAQDFVTKPFHTRELLARIKRHLRARDQAHGSAASAAPPKSTDVAETRPEVGPPVPSAVGEEDYWLRGMEASQLGRLREAMGWFLREAEECESKQRFARAAIAFRSASVTAGQLREHDLANKFLRLAGKMYLCWAENESDPVHVREAYLNAARSFLMAGNLKLAKKSIDFAHSFDAVLADDRPSGLA